MTDETVLSAARLDQALGSSPSSAVPIGVTLKSRIERGDPYSIPRVYDVEITILEAVRGKDAWARLEAQGAAQPPRSGFEYVLVHVRFGYYRKRRWAVEDELYQLTERQFAVVCADGKTQTDLPSQLEQPQPQLIGRVFKPGDTAEGWILLQVPADDKKPMLVFKREHSEGVYGIFGYLWFQL